METGGHHQEMNGETAIENDFVSQKQNLEDFMVDEKEKKIIESGIETYPG